MPLHRRGDQVVCVHETTDISNDDDYDHFEMKVKPLGKCPGTPVVGDVTACVGP